MNGTNSYHLTQANYNPIVEVKTSKTIDDISPAGKGRADMRAARSYGRNSRDLLPRWPLYPNMIARLVANFDFTDIRGRQQVSDS